MRTADAGLIAYRFFVEWRLCLWCTLRLPLTLAVAAAHMRPCAVPIAQSPGGGVARQVDRAFASKGLLPPWYMTLRLPLTLAAVAGLSLTLVASVRSAEAAIPGQAPRVSPGPSGPPEMQLAAQSRRGA